MTYFYKYSMRDPRLVYLGRKNSRLQCCCPFINLCPVSLHISEVKMSLAHHRELCPRVGTCRVTSSGRIVMKFSFRCSKRADLTSGNISPNFKVNHTEVQVPKKKNSWRCTVFFFGHGDFLMSTF